MVRVLIVDDDVNVRESLREALEGEFRVATASSAEDALGQLALIRPDAMVLDENLVGLNGIGLLELLESEPVAPPPVIMLCGEPDVKLARRAMGLGAVDVLAKPCDLGRLKLRLRQIGDLWRLKRTGEAPLALRGARAGRTALEREGSLAQKTGRFGRAVIAEAMAECRGDRTLAARRLRVSLLELTAFEADFNVKAGGGAESLF